MLEARLYPVVELEDGTLERDNDTLLEVLPLPNSTADSREVDDWSIVEVTPNGLAWDLDSGIELNPDEFLRLVGLMVEHINAGAVA